MSSLHRRWRECDEVRRVHNSRFINICTFPSSSPPLPKYS